ncbi:hypothetical protein SK128_012205 [Halocaridina rubra]|uniref:NtA domain-containing protein n=1 Tax=Halocaridina rubra TaxID=373956 RepID=A0AAN8XMU7_HALRR
MWSTTKSLKLLSFLLFLCMLISAGHTTKRPRRQNMRRLGITRRNTENLPEPKDLSRSRSASRPPVCEEEPTLEEREERAYLVFTGHIEWLAGGRNRVTRHIVGDEGVAGGVRVKRVFKGRRDMAGRILQVNGLGGSSVCNSFARVKDTKIFLTTVNDEGKIFLNSSLVRLTLKNLRKTLKAVQVSWWIVFGYSYSVELGTDCVLNWLAPLQQ